MSARAQYAIEKETDAYIIIRDTGHHNDLTVTNDAEAVVEELAPRLAGRRLYYYDSQGDLDELVVRNGKFYQFAPGGPKA